MHAQQHSSSSTIVVLKGVRSWMQHKKTSVNFDPCSCKSCYISNSVSTGVGYPLFIIDAKQKSYS